MTNYVKNYLVKWMIVIVKHLYNNIASPNWMIIRHKFYLIIFSLLLKLD